VLFLWILVAEPDRKVHVIEGQVAVTMLKGSGTRGYGEKIPKDRQDRRFAGNFHRAIIPANSIHLLPVFRRTKNHWQFILGYVLFHLFEGLDFLCPFVVVGWICTFWMIGGVSSAAKFILCFKLCHRGIITLVRGRAAADEFE